MILGDILKMRHRMYFVLPLLCFINAVRSLPQGAPTSVCQTMMPFHGGGILPQSDLSPYVVSPRRQGNLVKVTVTSTVNVPFQGFLIQGRTPNGEILGTFDSASVNEGHPLDCVEPADSLTHNSPNEKSSINIVWTPPEDYEGPVIFNATIAQAYDTFWVGVQSEPVEITKRGANDPYINLSTPPEEHTPPNFVPFQPKESSTQFDPFYEGCAVTKLCFGAPAGCVASQNCKSVVAVTVTGDKYDFELKAENNAAWVGVGLSADDKMGDDSVIECVKKGTGVSAYMSETTVPNYGSPRLSNPQLGIQLLNSSLVDGVIYCKVRRDASTNVNGKTYDLVNDKYNLLTAAGSSVKSDSVSFHDISYLASAESQSLADVSALAAKSKLLIRLHGCFMLAAWLGTASIGILLARYYRQTWVGQQMFGKDMWFAWHRALMFLTWCLTIVAFVLIFVELKAWSGEKNPHAILGTVTTVLCFIQPIGAYFRPHPGTPKRPVFNWLHWGIGNAAHIVGIVTIFFAVKLTKAELPEFVDWILVAYVVIHVISHLALSVLNCVAEKSGDNRVTSFPMKDLAGSGRTSGFTDRNPDAPFSAFRKFLLAVYILVIIVIVVALIVITALAPIEEAWSNLKSSVTNKN